MKLQTKKFLNLLKADTFWLTIHNRSSSSTVALNAHMVKMSHRLLSDKINFPSRSVHCVQGSPFTLVPERWMQGLKKGENCHLLPFNHDCKCKPKYPSSPIHIYTLQWYGLRSQIGLTLFRDPI